MRIGIFGGSFNPIHKGHIYLAENVRDTQNLDKIIFMPSKISPHKSSEDYVSEEHRMNMIKLAIEHKEKLEVSDYELKQSRVSYTYYTINHFKEVFSNDEIFLLIGSDMFLCFEKWKNFEDIMKKSTLIVTSREKDDFDLLYSQSEKLSKFGKIIVNSSKSFPVSSTEIRKKILKNNKYTCYLDENVVQYIELNDLYS